MLITLLAGCGLFSKNARLADIPISIDGNPEEWEPFPVVHDDPKGDNITNEYDISIVKAFSNNETMIMYILVESYIPMKDFTSVEIDLQYGDDIYRVGLQPDDLPQGVLAHKIGIEENEIQWEVLTNSLGARLSSDQAIEISIPMDYFTDSTSLKISDLRIMGGICCNQFEYFAIDYLNPFD